ncbi:ABC transporter substrate-binding protein [Solimicrobium silvestre]|uniref:ABC-type branched-chain amino acid transport systems periplasmic component n=1 Tax=Solimicrobium silvestre TaxID=2099400 RepID=A0A2S9GYK1_9BURK|nr:ABC transporter substrate-binding protein [Solimicrobium silvestre]PRC92802.1 ABC-type branched-chain amino acid transport systems periplasmic component [Solimicrobium silvestre]
MRKFFLVLLLILLSLVGCDKLNLAQQRAEHLAQPGKDITIAVAWPMNSAKTSLLNGIELARTEINSSGGVLGGKNITLLVKDDEASLSKGRLVAQEIANNIDVAAVIGHLNSYITEPASQIYEQAGLLMITPGASGQKMFEDGGKLIFRSLPGNREQARQIGDYAVSQGYKRIAIYYIKNEYGIDLANFFEQRANELGINVVDRRSYNMNADNHAAIFKDWALFLKMDAIFLIGSLPESGQILREARAAGITVPIFGGHGMDSADLIKLGGKSAEGTVVFSLFNIVDPRPEVQSFVERYQKRFGVEPDSSAAAGYDTLKLVAHAIDVAHSEVPAKTAEAMRATKNWSGVTGMYTFNEKGDLVGKRLAKAEVNQGKFVYFEITPPRTVTTWPTAD